MAIFRIHANTQYTAMSNYHLRDTSLSLQAMGMLSFMLSCREGFKFSIEGLTKCSASGETATRSALKELRDKGYLNVTRSTDEQGKVSEWVYDVYEAPMENAPVVEKPDVENPHVENQGQRNTNISITKERPPIIKSPNGDINNLPPEKVARFKKPTAEEVAAFCSEHGYGVDANAFIDFYDSKGWKIGKDTMKDWKAAVRTWERRHKEEITKQQGYGKQRNSKFADPEETMRAMLEGANAGITELRFNQDAQ